MLHLTLISLTWGGEHCGEQEVSSFSPPYFPQLANEISKDEITQGKKSYQEDQRV